ncbi:MAG: 4-amino-4-deoxy-L-arabinose transferase [Chloroflexota bacterium]|jgi:4-amino-4-deoxy-L-arabinose transferase-like glycosyltransferase|nr:4-amino-4-deoxy-L-arabinose transferase [Chloroflexota bacterium]
MRTALGLYAFAVLVRLVLIALYPDPAYVDSYYYVNVARALQAGHGFNIDFIWTFVDLGGSIPAQPVLPIPSNAHWMPLAALVQVPFLAILGATAWAAAWPFALIGSLAAPMTWAFAREAGGRSDVAVGAGILVAVPAAVVFMAQPDNFSLFQPIVLGALWLGARGLKGDPRAFAAAGVLTGLAMLARNDGILVGAALGLLFVWNRYRAWRTARRAALPWWSAIAALGLFVLVMAPWWARQLAVFGSISPSSASGRILWIRSLAEMNSIEGHPTLSTFLGQGLGPLVSSRVTGLVQAVISFVVLVAGVVLAPFMVVGAWLRRRSADFAPFFVYAALLFAFSALVSAVHVPNGTFIHSAVALAPQASILALEGVAGVVAWAAVRRRAWDPAQASRVFIGAAVVLTMLVGVSFSFATRATWTTERDIKIAAGTALTAAGAAPDDVVMSLDTGGLKYWTGHPGVVAPDDPIGTIERVARAYGARWLLVERQDTILALADLLKDDQLHASWIGPSVWRTPVGIPAGAEGATAWAGSDAALFPVCIAAGDDRCLR